MEDTCYHPTQPDYTLPRRLSLEEAAETLSQCHLGRLKGKYARVVYNTIFRSPANPQFCHLDLHPKNIIVENGKLAGIIDWGYCGWWPERYMWMRALQESKASYCNQKYEDAITRLCGLENVDLLCVHNLFQMVDDSITLPEQ